MTLGEMITMIRQNISEDVAGERISRTKMILYMNQALRSLWKKLLRNKVYYNLQTTTVTFTSQEVALDDSENLISIQKIVLAEDANGVPVDIRTKDMSLASDEESIYWYKATDQNNRARYYVGYYTNTENSPVFTISYVNRITEFNTTDDDNKVLYDIPEEHHDVIVLFTTLLILGKEEDSNDTFASLYRDGLDDMLSTAGLESQQGQGVVDVYAD